MAVAQTVFIMCMIFAVNSRLSLAACKSSEFTCKSGECVGTDKRCDRKKDCPDTSDEWFCQDEPIPLDFCSNKCHSKGHCIMTGNIMSCHCNAGLTGDGRLTCYVAEDFEDTEETTRYNVWDMVHYSKSIFEGGDRNQGRMEKMYIHLLPDDHDYPDYYDDWKRNFNWKDCAENCFFRDGCVAWNYWNWKSKIPGWEDKSCEFYNTTAYGKLPLVLDRPDMRLFQSGLRPSPHRYSVQEKCILNLRSDDVIKTWRLHGSDESYIFGFKRNILFCESTCRTTDGCKAWRIWRYTERIHFCIMFSSAGSGILTTPADYWCGLRRGVKEPEDQGGEEQKEEGFPGLPLGDLCNYDSNECGGENSMCGDIGNRGYVMDMRCICVDGFVRGPGPYSCVKPQNTLSLGETCTELNKPCMDPRSECEATKGKKGPGRCSCKDEFIRFRYSIKEQCLALSELKQGYPCKKQNIGKPCKRVNSECRTVLEKSPVAICYCKVGFKGRYCKAI